jgi:hypothetical protein
MDPRDLEMLGCCPVVDGAEVLERQARRVHHVGVAPRAGDHVGMHEAGGPNHDVGGGDHARAPQREEVGRAGAGADEPDLAAGSHGRLTMTVDR